MMRDSAWEGNRTAKRVATAMREINRAWLAVWRKMRDLDENAAQQRHAADGATRRG
jgi:hypothetical protein